LADNSSPPVGLTLSTFHSPVPWINRPGLPIVFLCWSWKAFSKS
jgi:hypothetical protein